MTDIDTIRQAIENTKRLIPDHFASLLGERPAGSTWGRAFTEEDLTGAGWGRDDAPDGTAQEGCLYFRLRRSEMLRHFPDARVLAVSLWAVPERLRPSIIVAKGEHGRELRFPAEDWDLLDAREDPGEAWLILGPHEGEMVVFTVFPGPVLSPCPKGTLSVQDALNADASIAVKRWEKGES